MKANRHNRGSVLMEFIIVFPIYLVLFGGVFMIGDMLVKATRLASADRVLAFDIEGDANARGWPHAVDDRKPDGTMKKSYESEVLFPNSQTDGDNEDLVLENDALRLTRYAYAGPSSNEPFKGPWSVAVGTRTKDRYKLSPWTKGWLNFALGFFDRSIRAPDMPSDDISRPLYGGSRYEICSKDSRQTYRTYSYYTLRRVRNYSGYEMKNRYRAMPDSLEEAGRLVDGGVSGNPSWMVGVRDEPWPDVKEDGAISRSSPPSLTPRKYERYSQFVTWSD